VGDGEEGRGVGAATLLYKTLAWDLSTNTATNRTMADTTEEIFKRELYRRYEQMKRVLIPKEQYFQIIDELKQAKSSNSTKSRHEYYLLTK